MHITYIDIQTLGNRNLNHKINIKLDSQEFRSRSKDHVPSADNYPEFRKVQNPAVTTSLKLHGSGSDIQGHASCQTRIPTDP
jgi:hypothetical protein